MPLIVNWPGVTPAGKVHQGPDRLQRLLPDVRRTGRREAARGVKLDGHSFAPQIKGEKGTPREWVYVELNGKSYVRDARFKLTSGGELFDMTNAPFEEIPVASGHDRCGRESRPRETCRRCSAI